jgi:tetratricopeptide (TPR) repeat protein
MNSSTHRTALLLAAALLLGALRDVAAQSNEKEPARLEARPAKKLVPFPEDEEKAARPSAKTAPVKIAPPAPRQSNFQPRFKPPAVRQAQHSEPVEEAPKSPAPETGEPQKLPVADAAKAPEADEPAKAVEPTTPPETTSAAASPPPKDELPGRALVDEAFAKSKASSSDSDYTAVIDLCRRAKGIGLSKAYDDYARRLLAWAYNRRGETRAKEARDKEALADFEASVEAGGTWRAIHNRGVSYAALGRVSEAMSDLNRAIEMNSQYPNSYFNRAELKYKQGDYPGAVSDYTIAIKLGPADSAILNGRGHALYRMERFGEALRDYGEAIKADPENVAAIINRGDTYSDLGQYAEAAKDYRAAVRLAPKMGRAFHSAAWFMATCADQHYRNDKLAIEAAEKAIDLDGADYRNLSTLAAAQASAGMFDVAKATQEKAIAKAAKGEIVTAEKMMALYHRDIAFRERPRTAYTPSEEIEDRAVRQASGVEKLRNNMGVFPTRQASGSAPPRSQGRPTTRNR